jgi:catechol 2,3-dioxygenase-like lactoylglutathione lyase family enzyme
MEPSLSFITLGVRDLDAAVRFYRDALGLLPSPSPPDMALFAFGPLFLALYPRAALAADAGVTADGGGFPGFALAHNVGSAAEVDRLLAVAAAAGGRIVRPAHDAGRRGRFGYFADPDGFLWEVAWNPRRPPA